MAQILESKKDKHILVPCLILDSISAISKEMMEKNGIKALILDVDNTLTTHGSQEVSEKVMDWLKVMKHAKVPMIIISNNTEKRIEPFAKRLGIPFLSMGMKPSLRCFKIAQKSFDLKSNEIAVIGDQIYTDIWGGNRMGMFTILVNPIKLEDKFSFKFKRKLEKKYIDRYFDK